MTHFSVVIWLPASQIRQKNVEKALFGSKCAIAVHPQSGQGIARKNKTPVDPNDILGLNPQPAKIAGRFTQLRPHGQ